MLPLPGLPVVALEDVGLHVPLLLAPTRVAAGTHVMPEAVPYAIRSEHLDTRWIDGRNWIVLAPFVFDSDVLGRSIIVPVGFVTDFASIPRPLWPILPPTGPYGPAALVHDDLYRSRGLATRAQADAVFLEAMQKLGVSWLTRHTMYWGVRAGGAGSYKGGL